MCVYIYIYIFVCGAPAGAKSAQTKSDSFRCSIYNISSFHYLTVFFPISKQRATLKGALELRCAPEVGCLARRQIRIEA